ncbi:hypothetical protein LNTAR_08046 [Lentisphaera araneosa HTCC2155]|uniref:Thioredoxin domain-containing protein n=1 Tax=Lentisphaera araneosa HTCC2155 TaxID=313628 RepID=A6DRY3_9BACT|nr:hypothetical protein [Lentisphaera araneosa]EDM25558.1 hypothetical protein LNTAR_08046 [Lentisphaera araneosa HTCC2155]
MKLLKNFFILLVGCFGISSYSIERWAVKPQTDLFENQVGTYIENIKLKDANGQELDLYCKESPLTVISIFDFDCPLALKISPKIKRLEQEFPELKFQHVYINDLESTEEVAQQFQKRQYTGQLLNDNNELFIQTLNVKTTCENFVIDNKGTLLYRGAFDDQYGINITKKQPENHYLKDALKAVIQGRNITYALTEAPGCMVSADEVKQKQEITYHKDVARILQNKCQQCHREGGVGPFKLMSYSQAKRRGKMIDYVLTKGLMPPWFAEEGGPWLHNFDLSPREKETLLNWLKSGSPEGDIAHAPAPKNWSSEGDITNPDLIVKFPKVKVKAEGFMDYEHVMVKIPITEDKWVRSIETRTENPQVLHHALSFVTKNKNQKNVNAIRGYFSGYVPGTSTQTYPEGMGKLLPKDSYLIIQLHYTPNGTPVEDQVSLVFDFYDEPPKHILEVKSAYSKKIHIPPHAENHIITAEHKFHQSGFLTAFNPHAHLRGKSFKYELVEANGKKQILLNIPNYDFNWQMDYQLAEPVYVPQGAKLLVTAAYDNSTNNKANPNPNATVRAGEQTDDEMMIGYFNWYAENANSSSKVQVKSTKEPLPNSLKKYALKIKEKVISGELNRQQAKNLLTKNIQKGVKTGAYQKDKVPQYVHILKNQFSQL